MRLKAIVLFVVVLTTLLFFFIYTPTLQAVFNPDVIPEWHKEAARLEKIGKTEEAKKVYIQALKSLSEAKNHEGYVAALFKLATLYKNNREFQLSQSSIGSADSLYSNWKLNSPLLLGDIKHLQGTLKIIFNENFAAINLLKKSLEIKRTVLADNDTSLSVTYNNLGMAYSNMERFTESIQNLNLAINSLAAKKENKTALLAKYHENLGITFARMGDYSKARDYQLRSLAEKQNGGQSTDIQNIALAFLNLGQTETTLGNLDSAFNMLNTAESLLLSLKKVETTEIDIVYNLKGNLYSLSGDYERALMYYNKSLSMLRRKSPGHPRIKEIEMNIGHIYFIRQEYKKSVDYYMAGLSGSESALNNIKTYRNLGRSLEALQEYDQAEKNFLKAIEMAEAKYGKFHYELSASYLQYGNFLHTTGQNKLAANYYKKALKINKQLFGEKNRDVAGCYLRLGELALNQENLTEGLQYYHNALLSLEDGFNESNPHTSPSTSFQSPDYYLMNALAGKGDAFYRLYKTNNQLKDLYLSFNNYKTTSNVINQIRNQMSSEESNLAISSRLREYLAGALRTTTTLYNVTGDNYYLSEAFRFAENGKSAILMAGLNDREGINYKDKTKRNQQSEARKLRNNIAGYKKLIYDEYKMENPKLSKIDLWREKLFELEQELELVMTKTKDSNLNIQSNRYGNKMLSVKELRDKLSNETIIEYSLTNDLLYTFILSKDTFLLHTTPLKSDFPILVSGYIDNIRHGLLGEPNERFSAYTKSSLLLYKTLIEPSIPHIHSSHLIIIPDGILGYIPFETLIRDMPKSKIPDYHTLDYLLKHYTIRYSYTASQNYISNPKKKSGQKPFIGFAPIYQNREATTKDTISDVLALRDIPGIREEVRQISNTISGGEIFMKEQATERVFKKISGDYEILHLALHTMIDKDNPMYSKMIFSNIPDSTEDQMLNAYEVYNLDLNARLAVLSSCNTGIGQLINGEGVMSLARGFIYSGVPSVVMTLWEAEDESASGLMPIFYNNLIQGEPIDNALKQAKLDYLEQADRLRSHPYFWSSYVMIGSNQPIVSLSEQKRLSYTILTLSILLLGALFVIVKKARGKL